MALGIPKSNLWYGMDILWNHPLFFIANGILFVFCLKLQCISYLLKHYSDDHHRSFQPYHDDDDGFEGNYSYNYGYNPYRPPSGGIKGKVEQKYWHTKQTMIQKLGKEQDSFVVAGDSEVDARLEVHLSTVCKKNNNGNYSSTTVRLLSVGNSNWRLKNFSCNVVLCIISHDIWSKHAYKFSIPLENNFFVSLPGDHGKPSKTFFFWFHENSWGPPLNFFNFRKFIYFFFLGPGSHKPVMFNALWKRFKMANIRKMIRCYINILVSYIT